MSWDAKLFQRHLTTRRFGREATWFAEVDSTNRWLAEHMDDFVMSGGVVITDHQTAGRGRYDRTWSDVPGACLLFSVLIHHDVRRGRPHFLSLLSGIAVAESLAARWAGVCRIGLKWPNDVLLNGKKVCGVLGQSVFQNGKNAVVMGVGVNVNCRIEELPKELQESATSISGETGEDFPREVLLAEILNKWELLLDDLHAGQFEALRKRWEALGPVRETCLRRREGDHVVQGAFAGLGEDGELLLKDDVGTVHRFLTGDLQA